jgi:hypothetical protein
VPIRQRLRDLVGSVSSRSTSNNSASLPTEDALSRGGPHSPPTSGLDEFALAQGQELLGPCRDCNGYWTRELARGQKPLSCPGCKRLGPPA